MNYPAVSVSVMEISKEALAADLHHRCVGRWVAREGGVLEQFLRLDDEGYVMSIEDIEDWTPTTPANLKPFTNNRNQGGSEKACRSECCFFGNSGLIYNRRNRGKMIRDWSQSHVTPAAPALDWGGTAFGFQQQQS